MKIVHLVKTYMPATYGGMEQVVRQMCISARQEGWHSEVVTCGAHTEELIYHEGVPVYRYPETFSLFSTPISMSLYKRARERLNNADIIQVHYPWPFADILLLRLKLSGAIVVSYHADAIFNKFVEALYAPLRNSLLRRAARIIATSPNIAESSLVLKTFEGKVSVVPLGLDEKSYPVAVDSPLTYSALKYQPYVLFVGVLRKYKGLEILIAASEKVNVKVVIVGEGRDRQRLEKLTHKLGCKNVHFLGFVDEKEKVTLIKRAIAIVLPSNSRGEAFGVALLEGAMLGKPLISTELGTGTTFVNIHGVTGLVVSPGDVVGLAKAINLMATDSESRKSFGFSARARFLENFTESVVGGKYKATLRRVRLD